MDVLSEIAENERPECGCTGGNPIILTDKFDLFPKMNQILGA